MNKNDINIYNILDELENPKDYIKFEKVNHHMLEEKSKGLTSILKNTLKPRNIQKSSLKSFDKQYPNSKEIGKTHRNKFVENGRFGVMMETPTLRTTSPLNSQNIKDAFVK